MYMQLQARLDTVNDFLIEEARRRVSKAPKPEENRTGFGTPRSLRLARVFSLFEQAHVLCQESRLLPKSHWNAWDSIIKKTMRDVEDMWAHWDKNADQYPRSFQKYMNKLRSSSGSTAAQ
jgi:hypothetical protein